MKRRDDLWVRALLVSEVVLTESDGETLIVFYSIE